MAQVTAVLEPAQMVELRASVAGRIETLSVAEGDRLPQGAPLASIDARVQAARLALAQIAAEATGAQARAQIVVDQAAAHLHRIQAARTKGAAKAWEVTQAEQALALAQADAQIAADQVAQLAAQQALEEATLREFYMTAPFDGTVLQILVEPGEIVALDTPILEFGHLARLTATAFVPEAWARAMAPGDRIAATTPAGARLTCTVQSIDPRIDPASRSVRVKLGVENGDRGLYAGTAIQLTRP